MTEPFRYEPSEEEAFAASMLRERGWMVGEPRCPDCHGYGHIWIAVRTGVFDDVTDMKIKSCPRGCPAPATFFSAAVPA